MVYIVCSILYYFILSLVNAITNHQSKHIYIYIWTQSPFWLDWTLPYCYSSQRSTVVWYLFCLRVDPAMSPGHFIGFVQTFVTPFHPMTSSNCNYQTESWSGTYYLYTICLDASTYHILLVVVYTCNRYMYTIYIYIILYNIIHITIVYIYVIIKYIYVYVYIYIILFCWFLVIFWWFRWQTKVLCIACHTESAMASSSGPWP